MSSELVQLETFSVYSVQSGAERQGQNPLAHLNPQDRERGWHVARNLRKPLNHLAEMRIKEELATRLNLHNLHTPPELFDENYAMLEQHQAGRVSTAEVISRLACQATVCESTSTADGVRRLLQSYATVCHCEFHPSDVCNLCCKGCTYGHDVPELKPAPINFPFRFIDRIQILQPKSMVIIGGGEPVLYKDRETGRGFGQLVAKIRECCPGIKLAMVTNGTHKPAGDWPDGFSWIRISLDAATAETYTGFRGKPMFENVVRNYLAYLEHDVEYVGISFLFAKSNVAEYAQVASFIYELVKREKPQHLHKVNIQYRPLRRDPYAYDRPFHEAVTSTQIEQAVAEVLQLADSSPEMEDFLRNQTNITAILGGNSHPPHEFGRCYYSQTFHIIRANGDLRPCFIRVNEPDFILGNIQRDTPETIALNTLYVGARRKPHCDAHGCRQCHVNYTFEQGLLGELAPSDSPEVLADPMY